MIAKLRLPLKSHRVSLLYIISAKKLGGGGGLTDVHSRKKKEKHKKHQFKLFVFKLNETYMCQTTIVVKHLRCGYVRMNGMSNSKLKQIMADCEKKSFHS